MSINGNNNNMGVVRTAFRKVVRERLEVITDGSTASAYDKRANRLKLNEISPDVPVNSRRRAILLNDRGGNWYASVIKVFVSPGEAEDDATNKKESSWALDACGVAAGAHHFPEPQLDSRGGIRVVVVVALRVVRRPPLGRMEGVLPLVDGRRPRRAGQA